MKHLVSKDRRLRAGYLRYENRYLILKSLVSNQKIDLIERTNFQCKLKVFTRFSRGRVKNRCLITGRAKSVYRMFGINRMKLKDSILSGFILSVRKSSW